MRSLLLLAALVLLLPACLTPDEEPPPGDDDDTTDDDDATDDDDSSADDDDDATPPPASLELLTPAADELLSGPLFDIEWIAEDVPDGATLALYWDTDNAGSDGTLIADAIDPSAGVHPWWIAPDVPDPVFVYGVLGETIAYAPGALNHCLGPDADGLVVLDVPTVAVEMTVMIDGAEVMPSNTTEDDYGNVALKAVGAEQRLLGGDVWDDGTLTDVWSGSLVPGTYEVHYAGGAADGTTWPRNPLFVFDPVEITEDMTLVVDLPVVTTTIDFTLLGEAATDDNTSDDSYPGVQIMSVGNGESGWPESARVYGGDVDWELPLEVRMMEGTYNLIYSGSGSTDAWPHGRTLLAEEVTLTEDSSISYDIDAIDVDVEVLLNGAAVDASNTDADQNVWFQLRNPCCGAGSGMNVKTWSGGEVTPISSRRIHPGTYDAVFAQGDGDVWPEVGGTFLTGLVIEDSGLVTIDVETAELTLELQRNGVLASAADTASDNYVRYGVFSEGSTNFQLWQNSWDTDTGGPLASITTLAIVGTEIQPGYEKASYMGLPYEPWPGGILEVGDPVAITGDTLITIDIETADIELTPTLDGAVPDASNTGPNDELGSAGFTLRACEDDSNTGTFSAMWDTTAEAVQLPMTASVLAGCYSLEYTRIATGDAPAWPAGKNVLVLEELDLSGPETIEVDVQSVAGSLAGTLDGAPLDAATTHVDAWGRVELAGLSFANSTATWSAWDHEAEALSVPADFVIAAGQYDGRYKQGLPGGAWPVNNQVTLDRCVLIE